MRSMFLENSGGMALLSIVLVVALGVLRFAGRGKNRTGKLVLVLDVLFLMILVLFFFDFRLSTLVTATVPPEADIYLDCSRSATGFRAFHQRALVHRSNLAAMLEQRGYRPVLHAFGRYRMGGLPGVAERESIAARSAFSPAWITRDRQHGAGSTSIALLLGDCRMEVPVVTGGESALPLYPVLLRLETKNSHVTIQDVAGERIAGAPLVVRIATGCHASGMLRIRHNGKVIHSRPLAAGSSLISFPFSDMSPGDHVLEASIDIPGDGFDPDDAALAHLRLQPRPVPVLLMTGRPDPEAGALDRLLTQAGRFRIERYNPGREPREPLRLAAGHTALLVLIHPGTAWREEDLATIRTAVRGGMPLLYVNGFSRHVPDSLAALLPVFLPPGAAPAHGIFPWQPQSPEAFRIAPLPDGLPGGDAFRFLFRGIRLRPGALLLGESGGTPAVSLGRYGRGMVAALFAGPAWDWDLGGAGYGLLFRNRENFFMGLIDHLLHSAGRDAVTLRPARHLLLTGDTLTVSVQAPPGVRPLLRLVREGALPLMLDMPEPQLQEGMLVYRRIVPHDGTWRLEYRTTGSWQMSDRRICSGPDAVERSGWGQVSAPALFALGGGRVLDPDNPSTFPPPAKPERRQSRKILPLSRSPVILVLLATLFLASVFLRWRYPEREG